MDQKRLLLAMLLMSAAILLSNVLFPPKKVPPPPPPSTRAAAAVAGAPAALPATAPVAARADTVTVSSELYRYGFSTRGAALVRAELLKYPSYTQKGKPVQLVPEGTSDFLAHRLVVGRDTVDLRALPFQVSARSLQMRPGGEPQALTFTYGQPGGLGVQITYTFHAGSYAVDVQGRLTGVSGNATLLTEMGPRLALHEAADHHTERELAIVTRTADRDITRERMSKLPALETVEGPLTWAGIKDKYFLAAMVASSDDELLRSATVRDLPDDKAEVPSGDETVSVVIPQGRLTTALPVNADGTFAFRLYAGPQDYNGLSQVGYELEDVTPYGYRWLQPIIRPVAGAVLWVLNAMHSTLGLAYGWVLILFGVLMRVVLWPLNAKAMRAQMKNMGVQPLMEEIRTKYKNDPQKQQEELMKLYREHGFNPLAGCLPMLIPFPVLITLFFVFQNTIAFRGASFLWLPDLSLRDPLYILPVILVGSMFALQLAQTRLSGMATNAQTQTMMYVMPLVMGFLFFSLPAGLNLYYAATQVASIPQQVLIAKERRRAQEEAQKNPKLSAAKGGGDGGSQGGSRRAQGRG